MVSLNFSDTDKTPYQNWLPVQKVIVGTSFPKNSILRTRPCKSENERRVILGDGQHHTDLGKGIMQGGFGYGFSAFMNILSDYAREDYFDDPSLSPKALWVMLVSCFTLHQNAAIFDPHLTVMVEDQIINKIFVEGRAAFKILPRSMLRSFGDQAMARIAPFKVEDKFFCWVAKKGDGGGGWEGGGEDGRGGGIGAKVSGGGSRDIGAGGGCGTGACATTTPSIHI
ncbi:hypothetical protein JHK85_032376 [Glycine max]|nr:hypothetical protein JHK85_032376 [Glycine max]